MESKQLRQCVRAIVLNFAYMEKMFRTCDIFLVISLSKDSYGTGNNKLFEGVSYTHFKSAYEGLISDSLGYISIHKKPRQGIRRTSIQPTAKLLGQISKVGNKCSSINYHPRKAAIQSNKIFLRDKNKKDIPYTSNAAIKLRQKNLRQINTMLFDNKIGFVDNLPYSQKEKILKDFERRNIDYIDESRILLKRVFNLGRFDLGGRFYNGWWQNIPEKYRHHIQLNGQKTIELDFSEMHPTLTYARANKPKPINSYKPIHNIDRKIGKLAFNMLLNADTQYPRKPKGLKLTEKEETDIDWKAFINSMHKLHSPIAEEYFGTGYGRTLQFVDSQIAEKILIHFANLGIPCLPIHDSFIVPVKYEEELHNTMSSYAKEIAGVDIEIKKKSTL